MEVFKVIEDAVRVILFTIDQVVYGLIPSLYKLIISLANIDLYSNNSAISALMNRVYIIVGIFMLFKLAFSIIRYIVDPNAFSDSAKGFTGLVKRILIALILLVSIPFVFSKIYEYQGKILNSQVIPNLILGTKENGTDDLGTAAVDLQFMIFGPFFSINTSASEFNVCSPDPNNRPLSNIIGSTDMALKDDCLNAFAKAMDEDSTIKASGVTIDKFWKTDRGDSRNFASLGALLSWSLSDGKYAINYMPVISTLCGGYLAFLLLSFCIDVATRAIKLMFLQILSPIAIITSIDPTTSSQNDKLKDWGVECLKTYISVFLRLTVIYVVIQMIKVVTAKLFSGVDSLYYSGFKSHADATLNIWIYIFLVLGAFSVAKKVPELLEKAFGIKMSGEISMNPLKGFKDNLGTTLLGVGAGAIGGGLVNSAVSGVQAYNRSLAADNGHGKLWAAGSALTHGIGSGVAGSASTLRRGVSGAMHGERGFKNIRNAYGSAMFARQQREDLKRQGVSQADIVKSDILRNMGIFTPAQAQQLNYDRDDKALKEYERNLEQAKKEAARQKENEVRDYNDYSSAMGKINDIISNDNGVKNAQAKYDEAVRTGHGESAAKTALDNAKRSAWQGLRTGSTPYGASNKALVDSYLSRINEIRSTNSTIGGYADVTNAAGEFDKASMFAAQNEAARIGLAYERGLERVQTELGEQLADQRAELENRKNDPQWAINEKANSASRVNAPQPEGWMPTGEIQGQYRDTFGPGGWGGGPGPGPGPGPRP